MSDGFGSLATFLVMAGESPGRTYSLEEVTIIGRDQSADIRVDRPDVRSRHACLCRNAYGMYELTSLATGGIRVNGVSVQHAQLRAGDRVEVGNEVSLLFTGPRRIEERAVAMQRFDTLGRFAGGIAHEFNNLLGSVISNLGYLRRSTVGMPELQVKFAPAITDAEHAIQRASALTARLIGFADRSRTDRWTNIGWMVEGVAELVARDQPAGVDVQVRTQPGVYVQGDPPALHQALLNLCANACDAMPGGGTLRLSVEVHDRPASTVVIEVSDTGVGMSESDRRKAFEPFFTTKPGRGVGLGLPTVERIVRDHLGEIDIDSEVDHGTRVLIRLPRSRVADSSSSSGTQMQAAEPMLLVIDDDDLFRRGVQRLLTGLGFKVVEARDGATAVAEFEATADSFALVILDVLLQDMPSDEILTRLKARRPDIRVVALTGLSRNRQVDKLRELGISGVIEKTAGTEALTRRILEAIGADA